MNGTELIAQERQRQIEVEGWTPEHDDEHDCGEMAAAGASYALFDPSMLEGDWEPSFWPWDKKWWKPSEYQIRNLVKAGALIAAEIDRLQRKENKA